jgi:superfamily II RNA helicase
MRSKFGYGVPATPTPRPETQDEATVTAAPPSETGPAAGLAQLVNPSTEKLYGESADAADENATSHEAIRGENAPLSSERRSPVEDVTASLATMIFREPAAESGQPPRDIEQVARMDSSQEEARIAFQATATEQSARGWAAAKIADVSELESLTRDANRVLAEVVSAQRVAGKDREQERSRGRGMRRQHRRYEQPAPPVNGQFAVLDESDVSSFHEQVPELAVQFPFELDTFQKRAVLCLERREDVFVAAHTSAGKTVVAEYAVALAAQNAGRVCYTSPIKSLSNQKFRDFSKKFESVGIVTGDVSIRQESQCLIMTTEILRSMLYRSDDMLRSVDWVVFDETQYLNDPERGVVWETCILMLPPHVRMIMLSATVPNALEFAAWVGRTKQRRVSVVTTNHRPVPLEHSLLHVDTSLVAKRANVGGDRALKTTLLLQQGGQFRSENYIEAIREPVRSDASPSSAPVSTSAPSSTRGSARGGRGLRNSPRGQVRVGARGSGLGRRRAASDADLVEDSNVSLEAQDVTQRGRGRGGRRGRVQSGREAGGAREKAMAGHGTASWAPLVGFLDKQVLTPAIIFCFSKRKCARAVESLGSVDFLPDAKDKARAHRIFEESMRKLQEADRNLPQVLAVREHLKKGIAAHHAGLLPIIKEVTEIMFSEGLIKVLFATETFAMGVNFPAKCVVFVSLIQLRARRRSSDSAILQCIELRAG